jgi:hypothetical protein
MFAVGAIWASVTFRSESVPPAALAEFRSTRLLLATFNAHMPVHAFAQSLLVLKSFLFII